MRVIAANQSYRSGSPLEVHFGLCSREPVDLKVTFLDGKVTSLTRVRADRSLEVDLQAARVRPVAQQL